MTNVAILQDAESLTALLSTSPAVSDLRYGDRQLRFMTPSSSTYTQSINFDMSGINQELTDLRNAFLYLPLDIKFSTALKPSPTYPAVAFKSCILQAITRLVVRDVAGGINVDESNDSLAFGNMLRLMLEADEDWLQAVGPELHYSRDRSQSGVVGLKNNAEITNPNIARYTGTPASGFVDKDNNFLNPAYNQGFAERNEHLIKATYSDTGVPITAFNTDTLSFTARIPLRALSDFLRELGEAGPIINQRLKFEFYLASKVNTQFCPITIGSVSTVSPGGANVAAGTAGTTVDILVTPGQEPRLYYHDVKLRPEHAALLSQRLAQGYQKRIVYRRYEVLKDVQTQQGLANGAVFSHRINSAAVAAKRLYVMCYPAGVLNGTSWPSVLVTGPNGITNLDVKIAGKNYLNAPLTTLEEQYEMLKDASHVGADSDQRECCIPFQDFRLTSRIATVDLSRAFNILTDPNTPMDIMVTGTVKSSGPVDIVYVLERLEECVSDHKESLVRAVVGPALIQA